MSATSKVLVILQFFCLTYLIINLEKPFNVFVLLIQAFGFFLSVWSVIVMRIGKFNVQPEVKKEASLIQKGPYKLIRNPMYTGLLLFFGAGLFKRNNLSEVLVFSLLCVILLIKIKLEENFLLDRFGQPYLSYKSQTYRLLPYIF